MARFRKITKRLVGVILTAVMVFSVCVPAAAVSAGGVQDANITRLFIGESVQFKVSGMNYRVTWASSDESVARAVDGTVIGVGQGTATITAECLKKIGIWLFSWYFTTVRTFDVEVITSDGEINDDVRLSDEIAVLFGVSPDEYDTDCDGLGNYAEVYLTSTHPAFADTDGDGISDSDEDADGDGLSNISEIELGIKPNDGDTDSDGLSDFEEINETGTDPKKPDTDCDGLSDSDETILGTDPLKEKTDGVTSDSERVFEQALSDENFDEILLDEKNSALPSLILKAKGNINNRIFVQRSSADGITDSRSVLGMAVDVRGEELGEGKISFSLEKDPVHPFFKDGEKKTFITSVICRYNNGTTEYLNTEYDEANNTVSAEINEAGTYFVLDVDSLFGELGYDLPISVYSNRVSASVKPQKSADVMAQADIVFIIDTTGSMSEEINNVKENITSFVDTLKKNGVSASLALISYQDLEADGEDSTVVHKNGTENWFYDTDSFKNAISVLALGDGGDYPECALDALETARLLDMRASAGKIFILVTDANYKTDNRYGIASMNDEIDLLKNAGVMCSVISKPFWESEYSELCNETNGLWGDIYGDFNAELSSLAEKIGSDIVGTGHWIYLDGTVPVPVRLDEKPYAGSTVDTDGDGMPDIRELVNIEPDGQVDLDALLQEVSGGIITGTNYGIVETYSYISNPTVQDTDFDGTADDADPLPLTNINKGILHYAYDNKACNIEFKMDYRDLLDGDSTKYSKDLSVLSILYSADTYDESYIELTSGGAIGGEDNGRNLGTLLGLNGDSEFIQILPKNYGEDHDDITDFFVGHKKIRYNGVDNEVIVIAVRGTNATPAEWSSNFDVGADTKEYYAAVGESHPHWNNKNNHKGFDVTATRVYERLMQYINENVDLKARKTILICGHSRGAAIANIIGARFEREHTDYNSFTYTFATPYNTTDKDALEYKTIFNIVNKDDIITYLPLEKWGFKKYGTTRAVSVREYYASGNAEGSFKWLTGVDYNDDSGTQRTLDCFSAIVDTREQLYKLDTSEDGTVYENDIGHLTKGGAEKELVELRAALEEERLAKFCTLKVVGSLAWWHVEVNYCPAYFMQIIANMATSTGPLLGRDVKGKYATAKTSFVASSGVVIVGGLTHPHMQPTYYLIAHNDLAPLPKK